MLTFFEGINVKAYPKNTICCLLLVTIYSSMTVMTSFIHSSLYVICPSAYCYVVLQYVNILQYIGCSILIWKITILLQFYKTHVIGEGL